jgi:hypothetical protein
MILIILIEETLLVVYTFLLIICKFEKLYIKQELYAILHRDPRIKKNSILVTLSDSSESITASVSFTTITNASIENLVVSNPGVLT